MPDETDRYSTSESSRNGQGGAFAGFLLGAALGSLGALLWAPRSGRETRQQLSSALKDLAQITESLTVDVQSQAERLSDQALQQWEDTLNRLREAIAAGIEASQEEARNQQQSQHPNPPGRNTITVPAESSAMDSMSGDLGDFAGGDSISGGSTLSDRSRFNDSLGFSASDPPQGGGG